MFAAHIARAPGNQFVMFTKGIIGGGDPPTCSSSDTGFRSDLTGSTMQPATFRGATIATVVIIQNYLHDGLSGTCFPSDIDLVVDLGADFTSITIGGSTFLTSGASSGSGGSYRWNSVSITHFNADTNVSFLVSY